MKKQNKNIGLALGGGAVLGAAHIGVLKALQEFDIPVNYIAGTSIGALVAAFYAFGKSCDEIEKITENLKWLDVSAIHLSKYGLLSNKKLAEIVTKTIGNVRFDEARIPLAMIATNISNGEKVILRDGNVAQAVIASSCIPGIYIPVDINNQLLVDGGIVENVPITPLKNMGADFIIAVDLIDKHFNKRPENLIEILLNAFHFTLINASKIQTKKADILITPDLSAFNVIDTNQATELIEKGYRETKTRLNEIKCGNGKTL